MSTEGSRVCRLYPSLPHSYRLEVCEEQLQTSASRPQDKQEPGDGGDASHREHIRLLERQRGELLSINEKWAKEYKSMVSFYKQKVQDLESLLRGKAYSGAAHQERPGDHHEEEEEEEEEAGDAQSHLLTLLQEAEELREQNSTLTRRGQHQQQEIRRLNKALEEYLQPADSSTQTLQEVWKQQAEVYKEDFLKERRDREKLKEKHTELESRLHRAHNELHLLKSKGTWTRPLQPVVACACKHAHCQGRQRDEPHAPTPRRVLIKN